MAQEVAELKADSMNGSHSDVVILSLKPQLCFQAPKADEAVQFYRAAFGAEELKRTSHPKRKADQDQPLILSAELKLGSSIFLVCDQISETANPTGKDRFSFCLETNDVEGAVAKAIKAGAVAVDKVPEADGCCVSPRLGKAVKDPFGHVWYICSEISSGEVVDA